MTALRRSILLLVAFPAFCCATELSPWYGQGMEFELRATYAYQSYDRIDTVVGDVTVPSTDNLWNLSLAVTPFQTWGVELEVLGASTRYQGFSFSHFRATGRYSLMDDVIGDPVSVMVGASLTLPTEASERDISLGYHGDLELEGHLSVGQELSASNVEWCSRWWAVGAVATANVGSPWLRGDLNYEWRYGECQQLHLFARTAWGMSNGDLFLGDTFRGYRSIRHQSVDLGVRYGYTIPCWWLTITAEYQHRVHAKNYPVDWRRFAIELFYPFSL